MTRALLDRLPPLALAALAWCALLLQLVLLLRTAVVHGTGIGHALATYFGFFTVLSNLFVALIASAGALSNHPASPNLFYRPQMVGCATTAIVLVGLPITHCCASCGIPPVPKVADVLLHSVVPVATFAALVHLPRPRQVAVVGALCVVPLPVAVLRRHARPGSSYRHLPLSVRGRECARLVRVLRNAVALLALFALLGFAVRGIGLLLARRGLSGAH